MDIPRQAEASDILQYWLANVTFADNPFHHASDEPVHAQPEQWQQEGVDFSELSERIYEAHDFIQHSEVTAGTNAAEKVLAAVKKLARVVKQLQTHKQP